jgi:hypothetical protein
MYTTSCKDESIKQVDSRATNVVPLSKCYSRSAVAPAVNQQTASTAATGMNPQHGQAGHRCDIAVGAPLNSPVAAANSCTTKHSTSGYPATTYTVNNAAASAPATPTAEGMNPPHGQENHRCDIAVGALR